MPWRRSSGPLFMPANALTSKAYNREKLETMGARQLAERAAQRLEQKQERRTAFTRADALLDLKREQASIPSPAVAPRTIKRDRPPQTIAPKFNKAIERPPLPPSLTRADEIKQQMEDWRKKNADRDFCREF